MAFSTSAAATDDALVRPGFLFGNISLTDPSYSDNVVGGCRFVRLKTTTGQVIEGTGGRQNTGMNTGRLVFQFSGLPANTTYFISHVIVSPGSNGQLFFAPKTRYSISANMDNVSVTPTIELLDPPGTSLSPYVDVETTYPNTIVFNTKQALDFGDLVVSMAYPPGTYAVTTNEYGQMTLYPLYLNYQLFQGQRADSDKSTDIIGKLDEGQKEQQQQHEETKGLLEGLPGKIGDMLKGLIIPSNEYFSNWFRDLNDWFSARLGFLYTPIDVLFKFCDGFLSADSSIPSIPVPSLSWDGVVFLDAQTVTFEWVHSPAFKPLQEKLYFVGNCAWVFMLLSLLHRKLEEVLHR